MIKVLRCGAVGRVPDVEGCCNIFLMQLPHYHVGYKRHLVYIDMPSGSVEEAMVCGRWDDNLYKMARGSSAEWYVRPFTILGDADE